MDKRRPYPTFMSRRSTSKDEVPTVSAAALVLGGNLSVLMRSNKDLDSNPKVAKKTGLSTSSVSRLLNGQVDATLETVERIAQAFQVAPWQLLVPNIEPDNLPALQPRTKHEQRLLEGVRELARVMRET